MTPTIDQRRGLHAHTRVAAVAQTPAVLEEYRIIVNAFGPNLLRDKLAMAIAFVERDRSGQPNSARTQAATAWLADLAEWLRARPGIDVDGTTLGRVTREIDVQRYMLASIEALAVTTWFKRALQAAPGRQPGPTP